MEGNIEEVESLLSRGADVNETGGEYQETPCAIAVRNGRIDIVKLILGRPEFKLDGTDKFGQVWPNS